jgi:hypothetical protein
MVAAFLRLGPHTNSSGWVFPDSYVFSPGTTIDLDVETDITGSFTYDPSTFTVSAISITLSGGSAYDGTYTNSSAPCGSCESINAELGAGILDVYFNDDLGGSPDGLEEVQWESLSPPSLAFGTSPTGGVEFASTSPVPEPSSLFLLVPTVAVLGLLRRRKLAA